MHLLAFLIGLFSLYSNVTEGNKVTQPAVMVANRHEKAILVCGYKIHGEVTVMRFSLLKKTINTTTEICSFSYKMNYETSTTGTQCEAVLSPSNMTIHITGLQTEDTGMYVCKLEVMYPPPYRTFEGNTTFIYVSDLISECAQLSDSPKSDLYERGLLVICVVTFTYSISVTCILLICKQRRKRWNTGLFEKILQSDSVQHKNYSPYYIQIN
ncbi:cytotoxic T-lymphocyte protein 4 [Spea bombifrons]|uniref:cytotoxic T-lymphocyte protein 4 n=1 Tax=Spea bombifrons TaxID=233779 RepID=UPI00234BAD8D|nr:cytotoxic T-lymphocyte protein 4 [Spea bombifrons]